MIASRQSLWPNSTPNVDFDISYIKRATSVCVYVCVCVCGFSCWFENEASQSKGTERTRLASPNILLFAHAPNFLPPPPPHIAHPPPHRPPAGHEPERSLVVLRSTAPLAVRPDALVRARRRYVLSLSFRPRSVPFRVLLLLWSLRLINTTATNDNNGLRRGAAGAAAPTVPCTWV